MPLKRFTVLSILLLGYALTSPRAFADGSSANWGCSINAGNCIGDMKLQVTEAFWPQAVGVFHLSFFLNEEVLFETVETKSKRILHLTESVYLYHGVSDAAEADSLRDLYQHQVGRVAVLVLVWIMGGFPEGSQAVTAREYSTRNFELEGKLFQVSAKRADKNEVLFRVVGPSWQVEGAWSAKKSAPWPDGTSMSGWTTQSGKAFSSLGEARKQAKEWSR